MGLLSGIEFVLLVFALVDTFLTFVALVGTMLNPVMTIDINKVSVTMLFWIGAFVIHFIRVY